MFTQHALGALKHITFCPLDIDLYEPGSRRSVGDVVVDRDRSVAGAHHRLDRRYEPLEILVERKGMTHSLYGAWVTFK